MSVSFLVIWGFYNINKYHGKRFQRTLLSLMDDHSSGGASFDLADIAFTVSGVRYESFARNCVDRRRAVILSCTMSCEATYRYKCLRGVADLAYVIPCRIETLEHCE